jgi:oligopeptidase B
MNPPRHREDPYFWLRSDDRKDEQVLAHLRKENAYGKKATEALDPLRATLYEEHKGHLKETDDSPPYPHGAFYYYTRTVEGKSYTIHCRKPGSTEAAEQVILDVNELGEGKSHCDIRGVKPSPDHALLAYAADYSGNETYAATIMDIATGNVVESEVTGLAGSVTWGKGNTSFYYQTEDEAKRPHKVWKHVIGTKQSDDVCLYTDDDELYYVGCGKSKSDRFLFIYSGSSETTEWMFIDLEAGDDKLVMFQPRQYGLRYSPEHHGDNFLIVTNKDGATEMCLMTTPVGAPGVENWKLVLEHTESRLIDDIELVKDFLVIEGREAGLTQVWVMNIAAGVPAIDTIKRLQFKDELWEIATNVNRQWDTNMLRITYESPCSPWTWYDVDMTKPQGNTAESAAALTKIKQKDVLNFNGDLYTTRRAFVAASDGTQVPISMVYRKDLFNGEFKDGKAPHPVPTMLYGYGSYGICIDPGFDAKILPYLDRGMLYCIAHVRGGGEMGRHWYEKQGKYLNKRNTFSDFIECAEHLVDNGYTTPSTLAIEGRSAGGLLMGTVLNMRPDLFQVAVAGVPFVDVMNTMCDPSIPLTTGEWEEWGNPNEAKYFHYMLSYSPMDNVIAQDYPNILITAGLHDPRVAYWEPAKWASLLRKVKTDSNEVIVKMDLESGHFSASDRYKYLREKAWEQAYVLDKVGLGNATKRDSL